MGHGICTSEANMPNEDRTVEELGVVVLLVEPPRLETLPNAI